MEYMFEFVGVVPILSFFDQQEGKPHGGQPRGAAYLASDRCTLDTFLQSLETVPSQRGWNLDRVVDNVIAFWLQNGEQVRHWKYRLETAGAENVLIARVADVNALKAEFESLLDPP